MAKSEETIRKCPRCGSKNIEVDSDSGDDVIMVYCEDCEESSEIKTKSGKRRSHREEVEGEDRY